MFSNFNKNKIYLNRFCPEKYTLFVTKKNLSVLLISIAQKGILVNLLE